MTKPFEIESYTVTERRRSWAACQENDTSDSAYSTHTITKYRVVLNGKIQKRDFHYESVAISWAKNHCTIEGVKKLNKVCNSEANKSIHKHKLAIAKDKLIIKKNNSYMKKQLNLLKKDRK